MEVNKIITDVPTTHAVVCNLSPGVLYVGRVQAYSQAGDGPFASFNVSTQSISKWRAIVYWFVFRVFNTTLRTLPQRWKNHERTQGCEILFFFAQAIWLFKNNTTRVMQKSHCFASLERGPNNKINCSKGSQTFNQVALCLPKCRRFSWLVQEWLNMWLSPCADNNRSSSLARHCSYACGFTMKYCIFLLKWDFLYCSAWSPSQCTLGVVAWSASETSVGCPCTEQCGDHWLCNLSGKYFQHGSKSVKPFVSEQPWSQAQVSGCRKCPLTRGYRVCSHDVTAAMLEKENKGTAAMLVEWTSLLAIFVYFYAKSSFCFKKPIWPLVTWANTL